MFGDRLMGVPHGIEEFVGYSWCTKNSTGDIWHRYCETSVNGTECDPYFTSHDISLVAGIPGITSGVIKSRFDVIPHVIHSVCMHFMLQSNP